VVQSVVHSELNASVSDTFDDEKADAARDLLRWFARAIGVVADARTTRQADDADTQSMLAEVRRKLSEIILDGCLLFD